MRERGFFEGRGSAVFEVKGQWHGANGSPRGLGVCVVLLGAGVHSGRSGEVGNWQFVHFIQIVMKYLGTFFPKSH